MTDGYKPEWDIDRLYGEAGEGTVRRALELAEANIEVKRKRRLDSWFYVEVAQKPRGAACYRASGINTTGAEYWAYTIGETGTLVLVPTSRLFGCALRSTRKANESDGDNPTQGRLVSLDDLVTDMPQERGHLVIPFDELLGDSPRPPLDVGVVLKEDGLGLYRCSTIGCSNELQHLYEREMSKCGDCQRRERRPAWA